MATYLLIATTAMQYAIDRNSPLGLGAEYVAVEMTPQMSYGMRVPGVWLFTLIEFG